MNQQDIQQIKQLLKDEFSENNKKLVQKIDEKIDELAITVNQSIGESEERVNGKLGTMENKLGNMENKLGTMEKDIKEVKDMGNKIYKNMKSAVDNQIVELQIDMDKTKYIHREEWDKLPPQREISRVLVEKGMKNKAGK